jgi:chemotaxis protein CheX
VQPNMIPVLTQATAEVFETMVFAPVKALPPRADRPATAGAGVIGIVRFTGSANGVVSFCSSLPVARQIAAAMLGQSADEVEETLPDAIGELTNMIAGSFRTRMADSRGAWDISTPNVTVGSNLIMRYVGAVERTVCPFEFGDGLLFVELVLTDPSRVTHGERHEVHAC